MLRSIWRVFFPGEDKPASPPWRAALFTLILLVLLLAFMAGVSTLLGLLSMRMPPAVFDLDLGVYRLVAGQANPRLVDVILLLFNDPGIAYTCIVATCLGYCWIKRRNSVLVALFALGLAFSIGSWTIPYTHWFGYRSRPFVFATDVIVNPVWRQTWLIYPSFPSGHVRELVGLSVVLIHFWPRARWYVVAFAAFIAFTRLYVGAHFVYDIIGGITVGLMTGTFALVAADRGSWLIASAGNAGVVKQFRQYFSDTGGGDRRVRAPLLQRVIRSLVFAVLLLASTFVLGSLVFTKSPDILASYFLDTNNSLVAPLYGLFDPSSAPVVYACLASGYYTLSALTALIMVRAVVSGKRGAGSAAVSIALVIGASVLLAAAFSTFFSLARPFAASGVGLPDEWRSYWPGPVAFPDAYLLIVAALSVLLANRWRKLRLAAYIYPFAAAAGLIYFGAAWPIPSLATIVAGYWVARWSTYVCRQVLPPSWRLGNDHSQGPGKDAASDGDGTDRPAVGVSGQV
ncbi:MAG: phosphatase PAP2 family protein [Dehalococcoidia bacterium]|nr:phosphatase PAP2 family protein [Dehalococcoidia bacterium]